MLHQSSNGIRYAFCLAFMIDQPDLQRTCVSNLVCSSLFQQVSLQERLVEGPPQEPHGHEFWSLGKTLRVSNSLQVQQRASGPLKHDAASHKAGKLFGMGKRVAATVEVGGVRTTSPDGREPVASVQR